MRQQGADSHGARLVPLTETAMRRLFAVLGDPPVMKATLVRQPAPGSHQLVELFETLLKPLVNAPQPSRFRF